MKLPVEFATNVGVLLGTASAVGYACGYLALRARSFALGTDPAFKLVDQVYVFAGVRFFVITLILALVLAPAILAIRWVALGLARALPDAMAGALQWLTLIAIAAMTLGSMSILRVNGLLLRNDLPASGLEAAVLGGSGGLRLALTFAPVLLAGLSAVWLYGRLSVGGSQLGLILGLVVALQAFMLPIYHGALFADRRVRVLAGVPEGVRGLVMPLAIVDRTADQATLLGSDGSGLRGLTTVALEKLDGIPVRAVVPLADFLGQLAALGPKPAAGDARAMPVQVADASGAGGGLVVANDATDFGKGFYGSLTSYFGMILESIGSLGGPTGTAAGELWIVDLDLSRPALRAPPHRRTLRYLLAGGGRRRCHVHRASGRESGPARRRWRGSGGARRRWWLAQAARAAGRWFRPWAGPHRWRDPAGADRDRRHRQGRAHASYRRGEARACAADPGRARLRWRRNPHRGPIPTRRPGIRCLPARSGDHPQSQRLR